MQRVSAIYVLYVVFVLSSPAPAAPANPDPRLPQWIAALASDDFAARDAASKGLVEAGDAAVPALEAAAKDPSPEVQARAREALKAIENRKIQPAKVLEILHGSAAFVEGGDLTLRDALKPVEKLGLRVDYDPEVDPAQSCSVTKHGQTALELVDQIAETCRLGFRVVPGGVRVVTKEALDAVHGELRKRLGTPMTAEYANVPDGHVLRDVSDILGAAIVLSPGVKEERKGADPRISLKVQQMPAAGVIRLVMNSRNHANIEADVRYGIVVLVPKVP
jgi:hypothetical protein